MNEFELNVFEVALKKGPLPLTTGIFQQYVADRIFGGRSSLRAQDVFVFSQVHVVQNFICLILCAGPMGQVQHYNLDDFSRDAA